MESITSVDYSKLYEEDYCLWLETMTKLLKDKQFHLLDIENLVEEVEGLTRSERRELRNRLTVLLEHLLKLSYWQQEKDRNARGWLNTIREQRRQIKLLLQDSPSLKSYAREVFAHCYQDAREDVIVKTNFSSNTFPDSSPFTLKESLNPDFLPD